MRIPMKGLSFYHAMSYLVTKAMNQVQMFRYVVKDGVIYEIDGRTPSLTELRKGEEQYCVNVPFVDDMEVFCAEAAKRRETASASS
ncbi:MAG: CatA-like O-acetyltransferase [Christensenellales bacterium]